MIGCDENGIPLKCETFAVGIAQLNVVERQAHIPQQHLLRHHVTGRMTGCLKQFVDLLKCAMLSILKPLIGNRVVLTLFSTRAKLNGDNSKLAYNRLTDLLRIYKENRSKLRMVHFF